MIDTLIYFLVLFPTCAAVIGVSVAVSFPILRKLESEEPVSFIEEFARGVQRTVSYKWNVAIFALLTAIVYVLPELTIHWPTQWSLNTFLGGGIIGAGFASTLFSKLSPL